MKVQILIEHDVVSGNMVIRTNPPEALEQTIVIVGMLAFAQQHLMRASPPLPILAVPDAGQVAELARR